MNEEESKDKVARTAKTATSLGAASEHPSTSGTLGEALRIQVALGTLRNLFVFTLIVAVAAILYQVLLNALIADLVYAAVDKLYFTIKLFKTPLLFTIYAVGTILIVYRGQKKALGYFDMLAHSLVGILGESEAIINLPPELNTLEGQLNQIKFVSQQNERTVRAAEARKNDLVLYLAHDIKTPLTSVIGYLSLLDEVPDMPIEQRARYLSIALGKAYRLEELVDEFFEITRYNLQNIPLTIVEFDLVVMCEQLADELFPVADARDMTIEVVLPERLLIKADVEQLARVLNNVLGNALAYGYNKSTVQIQALTGPSGNTLIQITNEGVEIPAAKLTMIFDKFYRLDNARASQTGGSGLGLAIAREIIRAHGGTIIATSKDGVTTFTIELPAR